RRSPAFRCCRARTKKKNNNKVEQAFSRQRRPSGRRGPFAGFKAQGHVGDNEDRIMSRRSKLLALAVTLPLLVAAQAPQSTGTIQGNLVDSTGSAAPEVKVRAVNQASGASRT